MAGMLTQLPLPLLPGNAREFAPGAGVVDGPDGGGVVWVHGLATFAWDAGDEAARRLAAVQLWQLKAARQTQVAAGFGVIPLTLWRWRKDLAGGGVAALVSGPKGPQRPSRLTPPAVAKIRELDGQGMRKAAIAAAAGVSETSVRNVLRAASAVEPARKMRRQLPGSPLTGGRRSLRGKRQARRHPPGSRAARCRCCRTRCRGTASGRWPGSGCSARAPPRRSSPAPATRWPGLLLALPALQQTGLLACARQVYGRLPRRVLQPGRSPGPPGAAGAAARAPRLRAPTRVPPPAIGRVLGLDRAPEVKTIRRKISELAAAGKAADLQMAVAQRRAAGPPGRARHHVHRRAHQGVPFGKRDVQKMHVARLKFPGPATEETGVSPMVPGTRCSSSWPSRHPRWPRRSRSCCPGSGRSPGRTPGPTLWPSTPRRLGPRTCSPTSSTPGSTCSPTARPSPGKDIPDLPACQFSTVTHTGDDGRAREYKLAESAVELAIAKAAAKGRRSGCGRSPAWTRASRSTS